VWWWWLGCGSGPTVAETPLRTVPLCEPWSGWELPVGQGAVVQCDERHLTVQLPPLSAAKIAPDWRLAVRTQGWEEDVDSSAPGLVNVRYLQGAELLNLSLVDEPAHTLLILVVLDRAPAKG
jgi:hypothetical protein